MWQSFFDNLPKIIVVSAASTSGIVALAMIILSVIVIVLFRRDDWRVRLAVFCMLIIGLGLAVYSVQIAASSVIDLAEEKYSNVQLTVQTFHPDPERKMASWALIEVEVYDKDGKPIEIGSVDTSKGPAFKEASRTHLVDGIIMKSINDDPNFWAINSLEDDSGNWIKLHFKEPSSVGKIKIFQYWKGACMRGCPDPVSGENIKIASYVDEVKISFDGRADAITRRFKDEKDVEIDLALTPI